MVLTRISVRRLCGVVAAAALAAAVFTFGAAGSRERQSAITLTVYSGREEKLVKPLFDVFTRRTGIRVRVRYGGSAELAATIAEEGSNTRADVFFAQDAGALGAIAREGRLRVLPERTLERVPKRFRAPGKRWIGTSGRARVVAYNTRQQARRNLPRTIWGYTRPRWKGKLGLPPTNASFQAFVTVMRLTAGEDRTRDWLTGIKANGVKFYANNTHVLAAIASGEIEVGFVNHYYLYQLREQQPNVPVANLFLRKGDPGAFVNAAGVGILTGTKKPKSAQRFVDFLLSRQSQRYFALAPGMAEYPLVRGVRPRRGLPRLSRVEGPKIGLGRLGRELEPTLRVLNEVGFTR